MDTEVAPVPEPAGTSSDSCPESVATEVEAVSAALACGGEVEVEAERTAWDTVVAQPDGLMRWDSSAEAVRTTVDDEWIDIDTTIVPGAGGYEVVAPVNAMVFSDGTPGTPLVRIERDGHELVFDVPFDLPAPSVDAEALTYDDVLPGVDLVVTVNSDATGFTEVLRVETPEAATHPDLAELEFPVQVSDGLALESARGGFVAVDAQGEEVFTSPVPVMWDSAADALPNAPQSVAGAFRALVSDTPVAPLEVHEVSRTVAPRDGDRVEPMPLILGEDAVRVVPDADLIDDPETVWPVYIDPSVSGSRHSWTAVRNSYSQDFKFSPDQGVGLCNRGTTTTCSKTFTSRLMWQFNGLGTIAKLSSNHVVAATFSAYGSHSYSCTTSTVNAYRVNPFTSSTGWPGGPWTEGRLQQGRNVAHKPACNNARWIEFDVTAAARSAAAGSSSTMAIGLRASTESSMSGWKRYRHDAKLSITYNRPPTTPTKARTTSPTTSCVTGSSRPWIRSTTPVLRATLSDPDGGNLRGDFELYNTSGTRLWNPTGTAARSSGSEHTIQIPDGLLKDGVTYQWRVFAQDPSGLNSPTVRCEFSVDLVPPVTPQVAAVIGTGAVYLENDVAGGVGRRGEFRLTNGGSSDVVEYKYSFTTSTLGSTVRGSSPVIAFTPQTTGPQRLYVQSVDRAGRTSPVRLYSFSVAFPGARGVWMLDEGSGAVAADTGGGSTPSNLSLSGGAGWGNGRWADFGFDPDDRALVLDGTSAQARTAGPVVANNDSFSALAWVRLASDGRSATAVSQDGNQVSGFELGYRVDSACPGSLTSCWAFVMHPTDSTSGPVVLRSAVRPQVGSWVLLGGVHDAEAGDARLMVCELGTQDSPVFGEMVPTAKVPVSPRWNATGAFAVGRGLTGGQPTRFWPGAVGEVRAFDGPITDQQFSRLCDS